MVTRLLTGITGLYENSGRDAVARQYSIEVFEPEVAVDDLHGDRIYPVVRRAATLPKVHVGVDHGAGTDAH